MVLKQWRRHDLPLGGAIFDLGRQNVYPKFRAGNGGGQELRDTICTIHTDQHNCQYLSDVSFPFFSQDFLHT